METHHLMGITKFCQFKKNEHFHFLNILIHAKVGGFAEIIRNFYNVNQFYGRTLSLFLNISFHSKVC